MFALRRASEFMLRFPARVASPLNLTKRASLLFSESIPFPITKAVLSKLNNVAPLVTVEPDKLYSPITNELRSLAVVPSPIAVELFPPAIVPKPIAIESSPLAVELLPIAVLKIPLAVVPHPIAVELSPLAVVKAPIAVERSAVADVSNPNAVE